MKKIILFCICLLPELVSAQEIVTDRPDQTETPYAIPLKHIQLESGFTGYKTGPITTRELPSLLIRYSLSEKTELRIVTTYSQTGQHSTYTGGINPVEAGLKVNLTERKKWIPDLGMIFHLVIPKAASREFQNNHYALNFRFAGQYILT